MQVTHVLVVVSQSPEQHWEPLVQAVLPFGRQHVPPSEQKPEQHCPSFMQPPRSRAQHVPLEQVWPSVQTMPQWPQLLVSVPVSTGVARVPDVKESRP